MSRFGKDNTLILSHSPIKAVFSRAGVPQIVLNERGLLHMEHFRPKPDPFPSSKEEDQPSLVIQSKERSLESNGYTDHESDHWSRFEQEDDGEWEESFGGKQDTKPKGPEALSLDIEFPGKEHVFGLPEHASPLNLRSTRGEKDEDFKEPYRLMNTDVFEYDHDSPMSLYGSVPVMHAQGSNSAASILWLSASETWIDIDRNVTSGKGTRAHFFSESGILDLFIFLKDTPSANLATIAQLVGRTPLPAYFAIGYHQCRWNYLTTEDILSVNARFTEEDIPVDVLWLDIEYAKNHWYGVWNEETFAKPERMLEGLDAEGRKVSL
jgi:alpha 1,3-glucosidase